MYELIQINEYDHYIDCPAKVGLVQISDRDVVLIDSGSDKDAAKKVYRHLTENNWNLTAIYNTHSHADHIGGNRFLQDKTGCHIYAPGMEQAFCENPLLEPVSLYGGLPFKELKHKFLMAQDSRVLPLTEDSLPPGMKILKLPGHSFEMVGFLTTSGTAYIADSVSSAQTLEKYGIGYMWDHTAALETLEYLPMIPAAYFVPAHAPASEDIREIAELNAASIRAVRSRILESCSRPITFEHLMKEIFTAYGLTMTAQQYVLIGSTLRSYLSSLYTAGEITYEFTDNEMLWKTAVPAEKQKE